LTFCTTIQTWHVFRLNFWHSPIASTSMRSFWLYSGERQLSTWQPCNFHNSSCFSCLPGLRGPFSGISCFGSDNSPASQVFSSCMLMTL
jgi:hypothetical protein